MKITIEKSAGFCPGVKKAIKVAEEKIAQGEKITALGALIHNDREMERLQRLGLRVLDQGQVENDQISIDQLKQQQLLIRAHGISPFLKKKIEAENIYCIDGTCSLVVRSQRLIKEYYEKDYQVVIVGKAYHPEVRALMGFCENKGVIVYDIGDENKIKNLNKVLLMAQTTIEKERFEYFSKKLEKGVDDLIVKNTICPVVTKRQQQIVEFAKQNDIIIFIAGRESSNSKVLFELCQKHNQHCYFVSSINELQKEWFKKKATVGITGGASTPYWQLEEFKQQIHNTFN